MFGLGLIVCFEFPKYSRTLNVLPRVIDFECLDDLMAALRTIEKCVPKGTMEGYADEVNHEGKVIEQVVSKWQSKKNKAMNIELEIQQLLKTTKSNASKSGVSKS